MHVIPIKIAKVRPFTKLLALLDRSLAELREGSIVAITSKLVSITQGRMVKMGEAKKQELIEREADYFLPGKTRYHLTLTIKDGLLIPAAGIDESNGGGYYILWPDDPQGVANQVRAHLARRWKLKAVGVMITDSKTTPLRRGTTGVAIAHSGFAALRSYIGKPDLFGRKLKVTKANILDGLAAAAVLVMGEGSERIPLAVIEDVAFVDFQRRNPFRRELADLRIPLEDDLYAPLLKATPWRRGQGE
jgi:putative folate metabolism gamma-glutamate ligase